MIAIPSIFPEDTPRARYGDPLTSHEAADSNSAEVRSLVEHAVLMLLEEKPMTDAELTARYFEVAPECGFPMVHMDSVRKRRSDLTDKKRGLVIETNLTRLSPSGRKSRVYGASIEAVQP